MSIPPSFTPSQWAGEDGLRAGKDMSCGSYGARNGPARTAMVSTMARLVPARNHGSLESSGIME